MAGRGNVPGLTLTGGGADDLGAFLARLVRLDQGALARLVSAGPGRLAVWGVLPWQVLVSRTVAGSVDPGPEAVVGAAALLSAVPSPAGATRPGGVAPDGTPPDADPVRGGATVVPLPAGRDAQWRAGPLPGAGLVIESLPAEHVRQLGSAAERTAREAGGRVGVRDALLDHIAIVVRTTVSKSIVEPVEVPQRLVQAVVRMGFLRSSGDAPEPPVRVLVAGPYVGLAAEYGVTWYRKSLRLPLRTILRTVEPR